MCGLMVADHVVPVGAIVSALKICENCAAPFLRPATSTETFEVKDFDYVHWGGRGKNFVTKELRRDRGRRYCMNCQARALAPVDLDSYKEQLPGTSQQMKHSPRLPRTDHTLDIINQMVVTKTSRVVLTAADRRQRAAAVQTHTIKSRLGDWKSKLLIAFAHRGPLSYEQMREITGHKHAGSIAAAISWSFPIVRVGSVWPRPYLRMAGTALYLPVLKGDA